MAKRRTFWLGLIALTISALFVSQAYALENTQDHSDANHTEEHHDDAHATEHDSHEDANADDHSAADHGDAHGADHGDSHGNAHAADHGDAHGDSHGGHADPCAHHGDDHGSHGDEGGSYDPQPMIMHHIGDANEWEITHGFTLPLPCIPYVKGKGFQFFMSSKLKHGEVAYNGFIMDHGRLMMINEADFPMGEIQLDNGGHFSHDADGNTLLCYNNQVYHAGRHSLSKTGFSFQWLDFSITKNVTTMLLVAIIMMWIFFAVAASYKKRAGMAPSGLQNFMEPLIQFVRDDVVEPNLGDKTDKYLPYIMAVFFFIWIGNMLGQLPFIANPNLTGNITITMALALITFFLTNISGNKAYWSHIFVVPGTPIAVRPLLIVIEVAGVFIKPFALMVRLFANITAGHIIILSLTSLIFVFGNLGESIGGAVGGVALAVPFGIFMGLIELLVAFLQAFIFAILSSLFIGMAVEDHH